MSAGPRYPRYRIRVGVEYARDLRPDHGVLDGGHPLPYLISTAVLDGRLPLRPGHWVELVEGDLRACCSTQMFDELLLDLQAAPQLEVERKNRAGGQWEPLSSWRLDELRKADDLAAALRGPSLTGDLNLAAEVDHIRTVRSAADGQKPGRGETARHLIDHRRASYEEAVKIMTDAGERVYSTDIHHLLKNGRRRNKACRFC